MGRALSFPINPTLGHPLGVTSCPCSVSGTAGLSWLPQPCPAPTPGAPWGEQLHGQSPPASSESSCRGRAWPGPRGHGHPQVMDLAAGTAGVLGCQELVCPLEPGLCHAGGGVGRSCLCGVRETPPADGPRAQGSPPPPAGCGGTARTQTPSLPPEPGRGSPEA